MRCSPKKPSRSASADRPHTSTIRMLAAHGCADLGRRGRCCSCSAVHFTLGDYCCPWKPSDSYSPPSLSNELPVCSLFILHPAPREAISPSPQLSVRLHGGFRLRLNGFPPCGCLAGNLVPPSAMKRGFTATHMLPDSPQDIHRV